MNLHPLIALRRHPRRSVVLAVLLTALLIGALVVAVQGGPPMSKARPEGAERAAGPTASGGTGSADGAGEDPTSSPSARGEATTGAGLPADPGGGTSTGGSAPPQAGEGQGAGGRPASGVRIDPPTPVPPRPPVRCASTGPPQTGSLPPPDENDGRRWLTVGRLAGNCDLSSPRFRLQGIDTRLVWRSDADSFAVFLVDAVQGRDATGGFADGQCAGSCSESQPIVPAAGEYALEVRAGDAPWEVEVQEYRRP